MTYVNLFTQIKNWCPEWNPQCIKMDFETAVLKAVQVVLPNTEISGCNFHYNQCLWRKIQEIGLSVLYKDNKEIKQICRMCSALSLIPIEFIDEAWIIITENAPTNDKLWMFLDYFVEQWQDNRNLPIQIWNVYGCSVWRRGHIIMSTFLLKRL